MKEEIELKTAEQIVQQMVDTMPYYLKYPIIPYILEAMEAYHAQFAPSAKSVEVEEAVREAAKAEMGVSYEPHMSQMDQSFIEGAEFGANWQQQKEADTISQLREALEKFLSLEDLISYSGDVKEEHHGEAQAINNAFRIAKEALKENK